MFDPEVAAADDCVKVAATLNAVSV